MKEELRRKATVVPPVTTVADHGTEQVKRDCLAIVETFDAVLE